MAYINILWRIYSAYIQGGKLSNGAFLPIHIGSGLHGYRGARMVTAGNPDGTIICSVSGSFWSACIS